MNRVIAIAERVARQIIPDLDGTPLYVIEPRAGGLVTPAMLGGRLGCHFPNLDLAFQPELEAQGLWRGPGACIVVRAESGWTTVNCLLDYEIERYIVGTVLHEICHHFDRPERVEVPESNAAYQSFRVACESGPQREATLAMFPPGFFLHDESWQRLACHVLYRANYGGGFCLSAKHLAIGSTYDSLEFLPGPQQFIDALYDEVRHCADLPLRAVAALEQPAALIALWDTVLESFVVEAPEAA